MPYLYPWKVGSQVPVWDDDLQRIVLYRFEKVANLTDGTLYVSALPGPMPESEWKIVPISKVFDSVQF